VAACHSGRASRVVLLYVSHLYNSLFTILQRLQAREALGEKETEVIQEIGFVIPAGVNTEDANTLVSVVKGIEEGRRLARDIGGADPEVCRKMFI